MNPIYVVMVTMCLVADPTNCRDDAIHGRRMMQAICAQEGANVARSYAVGDPAYFIKSWQCVSAPR